MGAWCIYAPYVTPDKVADMTSPGMKERADNASCALTAPTRRLLGPGPSDVSPRVLAAMAQPTVGHLDPFFVARMDEVKEGLRRAFMTRQPLTFPVSAPGSAGMEACVVNLVEPGDTVVIGTNGVFGGRMAENARRAGAEVVEVTHPWGSPVDPGRMEEALRAHPEARVMGFVHAETSTGVRSDANALAKVARAHDCLTIVDTVTSLGGIELRVDDWALDAVYSGSQKCLSCTPGLSPVTFSGRALDRVDRRKTPVQSWFLDLSLVRAYWESSPGTGSGSGGARSYHHTAPVNAVYGLHESLTMLHEEGLEAAWARHQRAHEALVAGARALGLTFRVPAGDRLPQLNVLEVPAGVDDAAVRGKLLEQFGIEIGAGLGPWKGQVWRVGLMGFGATTTNVLALLEALESILGRAGGVEAASSRVGA